jgi:hypothetical protein
MLPGGSTAKADEGEDIAANCIVKITWSATATIPKNY